MLLEGSKAAAFVEQIVKLSPNAGTLGDSCNGVLVPREAAASCSSTIDSSFSNKVSFFLEVFSSKSLHRGVPVTLSSGLLRVKSTSVIWLVSTRGVVASDSSRCTMCSASLTTMDWLMGGVSGVASISPVPDFALFFSFLEIQASPTLCRCL